MKAMSDAKILFLKYHQLESLNLTDWAISEAEDG